MLDCRSKSDFEARHLEGTVSCPISIETTLESNSSALESELPSIFLPPRHVALLVVGSDVDLILALARHLETRGRVGVDAAILPEAESKLRSGLRWRTGPSRRHLWRPPEYLSEHLGLLPPPAAGPVLDLACGSGRACVWLAERGYQVTGIDWQPEALDLGRKLAANRGVRCEFLEADLRSSDPVPPGPWSVILNFRFLQRELLAEAWRWLRPGGVILVRTFREAPGYEGHPHRRHRLAGSELPRTFPAGQFEILAHEENHDSDGRPAAGIVARRRFVLPVRSR